MKKKRVDAGVSEIIGTILMLGMAIALFSSVSLIIISYPLNTPSPQVDIVSYMAGSDIIFEHHGGPSLPLTTQFGITVYGTTFFINAQEYIEEDLNQNDLWDIGEQVIYTTSDLPDAQVDVLIIDYDSNSVLMMGRIQDGPTIPSLNTFINPIVPYEVTSTPLALTAEADPFLEDVRLYYRWSDDNISWDGGVGGELKNAVDSNTSDVDGSADIGIEANFVNAQDTSPDGDYMNIQEADQSSSGGTEDLYVNAYDNTYTDWSKSGVSPYLDAVDSNRIKTKTGITDGWYDFPSTIYSGTLSVDAEINCLQWNGDVIIEFEWTGDITAETSIQMTGGILTWIDMGTVTGLDTASEVNSCRIRAIWASTNWVEIDSFRLEVTESTVTDYEMDFEYQFTSVDTTKTNNYLCFEINDHTGNDNLYVSYRNGGSWTNLGVISGTGWTNFTAADLSSTYTIRVNDTNQADESTQDDWNVDVISLHAWNSTGGIHGINWTIWNSVSNPDTQSPWNWNFNFPNTAGYYEFYSIGQHQGISESAPVNADARCNYNP